MNRRLPTLALCLSSLLAGVPACAPGDAGDVEDGEFDSAGGKADSIAEGSAQAAAILALVNDPSVDKAELDFDAGLSSRAATNIIKHRDGSTPGSLVDPFDDLAELDDVPYVGSATLKQLLAYATAKGLLGGAATIDVVFSPQPAGATHTARVAQMIRAAQESVDIAMYSYSDAGVGEALADAVARGVKVRFLFETAGDDKRIADLAARTSSKSGRLESAGVDVRWVNKILHHKFVIVDGPRDDAERARTTKIATGSANWSFGGAQTYDENTLFIDGSVELAQAYQREFDLLWAGSGDFALATPIEREFSTTRFDVLADEPGLEALFTSDNFIAPTGDSTTFRVDKTKTSVADQWVRAIEGATESIQIASGHLRLRAVAEALIAKRAANPEVDIQVYLDQQEFISASGDSAQRAEVEACEAAAGDDESARLDCAERNFLYGRMVGQGGIDVRYKVYSYRWNASYAVQMHNKYMIIDGDELLSGSFNLSMNSEHGTFENVVHVSGPAYAGLIDAFEANFAALWDTGRDEGVLDQVRTAVTTSSSIPLIFDSVAVTWQEYNDLRTLIRANCPAADSSAYRSNPAAHRTCPR
ncbi:MAG: phospholipase D-like domain-containing protein [Kofleriaceae bacterium]